MRYVWLSTKPCGCLKLAVIFLTIISVQGDLGNPRIVEHPDDDYVAKNEPATLNCKAEGEPKPKITWYRNGRVVVTSSENPQSHRMLLNTGQLFFLRVIHNKNYKPDVGVYYCNATNIHGSAISRNATLEIAVLRDDFRERPISQTVATGETATFHCKPPKGEPEPKVLWHHNSEPLQLGGRIAAADNGDLVIKSVMVTDAGKYTCLAINKGGEKESTPATLTVLEKPKFRQMPDDIQANEGDTIELKCRATGDPKPTVQWKKQDGRIPYGRARKLDDGTLRIEKVEAGDDGQYICVAENSAGTVEAVGKLSVQTHPTFVIRPQNQVVGLGRTVTLQCVVSGNPVPTVFWSKGSDQPLMFPNQENGRFSVSEDGTFRIDRVQFEDKGEYICQALNVIGSAQANARIEVRKQDTRPPPVITIGPQNQTLPVKEVAMLPCQATGDPQPAIRWYKNGRPILGTDPRSTILDSGTLQISDVKLSDSAIYTCKAVSETGETNWAAQLTVANQGPYHRTQKPSTFPDAPLKPFVTDVTDATVDLTWQPGRNPGDSPVFAFIVEYFSHETSQGWVVASDSITRETYTVRNLKPQTSYVFIVRAKNSHGISLPSPISDDVLTRERRKGNKPITLPKAKIQQQLQGMVVEIQKGEAVNATAIKVSWRVLKGRDAIGGFYIHYKHILSFHNMKYGKEQQLTLDDPYRTSFVLQGLYSAAWYEICIQAYGRNVKSQCSSSLKVITKESTPSSPPENVVIHKDDASIYLRWSPPPLQFRNGDIKGYDIYCMDNDKKHNCSFRTNSTMNFAQVKHVDSELTYRIRIAARTSKGVGVWSKTFVVGPEQPNIMKEPWFIGMLIATIGGTLWLALCIFSIWLCRKRKNRKKLIQNGMYSAVPVHKSDDSSSRNTSHDVVYAQKDGNIHAMSAYGGLQSDLASLLDSGNKDVELKDQNIYNSAGVPQMKTFYQKPNAIPLTVAPYATTTLINTSNQANRPMQANCMESAFRPINHAYVHSSASGSGDSCQKPDMKNSDSNTDNSRQNSVPGCTCQQDGMDCLASPGSDSGSLTTDEYGMPVKRSHRNHKHCCGPNKTMVNWAELLPPPPEHPPPSDLGTPPDSPMNTLNRHRHANNGSPLSPVSKISACSCPAPHDRMPQNIRCVPYSDAEFSTQPRMHHECRPYSPKQLNRSRSPAHDGQGQYPAPHGMNCHMVGPGDCSGGGIYPQRMCHSDAERVVYKMGHGYTPISLHGYKIGQLESDLRQLSDPERGGAAPPRGMCVHGVPSDGSGGGGGGGPSMDRACQSSLPSLSSECINSPCFHGRNGDSPVSEEMPDYAGESDMEVNRTTDCPTPDSSVNGEGDGSLSETDFATAVARAAELSGMTVVGTTVTDPKAGKDKKYRKHHRQQQQRPTSPYSTDSNYSAVIHRPFPRSQRKKQLVDQGKRYGNKKTDSNSSCCNHMAEMPHNVGELPMYNRPLFPHPSFPLSTAGSAQSSLGRIDAQNGYTSPNSGVYDTGHIYEGIIYGQPNVQANSSPYHTQNDIPIV
ncbi:roundabout homolog 2-like isoform X3 [Gigantopelta aegis]|uniref:roundabout homolog 2-like isoform X3 n=1 Tax=Gigantopelta aegis TaxID=1735272 RepID=UPI001B889EF8|nr:roundabout homolog 2-like isoform X3 [Gigantopelta aegis]